jgi:hypothetical protein
MVLVIFLVAECDLPAIFYSVQQAVKMFRALRMAFFQMNVR